MRFLSFAAAGVFAASALSTPALAYSSGVGISGRSGKPTSPDGGMGPICTTCHAPGAAVPEVTIVGPNSVVAGTTTAYAVTITGGPGVRGGFNLSVDNDQARLEAAAGSGVQVLNGEVTHNPAKTFTDGGVRFDFSLVAPASGTGMTLYAAGNSANGSRSSGDGINTTSLYVSLRSPGGEPDGGAFPDGGSEPDAGSTPDAGPVADAGTSVDAGSPADAGTDPGPGPGGDTHGGCSSMGGGPVLSLVLGAVGLTLLRRRRA